MINESFDDDIPDDDEFIVDPEAVPAPRGDFKHVLSGRDVWFNAPIPGQFHAWKRYRNSLETRYAVVKVKAKKSPSLEVLRELADMSEKFDLITLEFVESMVVDPDDVDFLQFEMISGRVTMNDMYRILFGDPEPDDDTEPAPKPKKSATPKKVVAAKKVASARRTRK